VLGAIGGDVGRHVMQEVGLQVELLGASARPRGGYPEGLAPRQSSPTTRRQYRLARGSSR
jgi:hypothetical protein